MNIDAAFEKYPNILIGVRQNGHQKIFDFWKSNHWSSFILNPNTGGVEEEDEDEEVGSEDTPVPANEISEYKWKHQKDDPVNKREYYILYSDKLNFSELFLILSTYLEYNLDMEKKRDLFHVKVKELEQIFNTLNYSEASKVEIKIKK